MDERVYAAYGAAMAREKDRDFALHAGAQAQQAAHQSSALAQQDQHFEEQQRQQANLAYAHMNQQENMQQSQQDAAMRMQQSRQNFEFTQADNLRLQRLNQDVAGWEQLHVNGEIDDDEYNRGLALANRGRAPLQAKREASNQMKLEEETRRMAQQTAHLDSLDALRRQQQARTGPDGTFQMRNPNDPTGQTMLPGLYYRDHQGNPQLVPHSDGGGSGTGGSRSAAPGSSPASMGASIDHATNYVNRELAKTPEQGGIPENDPRRSDPQRWIQDVARQHNAAAQALNAEDLENRRLSVNGPMPFDVPENVPPSDIAGTVQSQMQRGINSAVQRAEWRNQPDRSQALRRIARDIKNGHSTGELSDEQQRILKDAGYYHDQFTPEIDRAIAFAARPMPGPPQRDPSGVTVRQMVRNPEMTRAADNFRAILATLPPGQTEPAIGTPARQLFDQARGRLGLEWPPRAAPERTQPPVTPANAAQAPPAATPPQTFSQRMAANPPRPWSPLNPFGR
jgi:hypothetical protein